MGTKTIKPRSNNDGQIGHPDYYWNKGYFNDLHINNLYTSVSGLTANTLKITDASISFEGTGVDDFETFLTVANPTADRVIVLPDTTGTVALTSDIPTVTTLNGSTANGLTTYASANTLDVEQYLLFTNSSNISTLELLSDQDTGDKFSIATTTHGATTISTVDDDAAAAHLTLFADGDTIVKTTDGLNDKNFKINVDANTAFLFNGESGSMSKLTVYEQGGDSANDFFTIQVEEHGATTIQTTDGGGSNANLQIIADGTSELVGTTVTLDASANIELEASGQLNLTSTENKINKTYDFHGTTFETTYSDDQASGTIIKYSPSGSTALNGSEIYYLRSNGMWLQANASGIGTTTTLLGVGLGGDPQTVGVLLKGFVRVASTEILNKPTNVPGMPLYISTTAGHFDFTAPSAPGDVVRIVGYAIDEDGGDVLVYFDPDKTYVEIA